MESLPLQVDGPITGRAYIRGGRGAYNRKYFLFTGRWAYNWGWGWGRGYQRGGLKRRFYGTVRGKSTSSRQNISSEDIPRPRFSGFDRWVV